MLLQPINPIIPVTVVDNFFDDPDSVREFALAQNYTLSPGHYPGFRSQRLDIVDQLFEQKFTEKAFSLFFDFEVHEVTWSVESSFQVIPASFEEGWVHDDRSPDGWNVAGLIYLHPDPAPNSGTSICSPKKNVDFSALDLTKFTEIKRKFYRDEPVDIDVYRQYRNTLNSMFTPTATVENVYNRLMMYSANELHKANNFFGNTVKDSRLTLLFYARIDVNNAKLPLVRT